MYRARLHSSEQLSHDRVLGAVDVAPDLHEGDIYQLAQRLSRPQRRRPRRRRIGSEHLVATERHVRLDTNTLLHPSLRSLMRRRGPVVALFRCRNAGGPQYDDTRGVDARIQREGFHLGS
jgi:hypothetical protein